MIAVCCYSSLAEAAYLRQDVNALNLESARPDPFSTFEFYENFLRHDEGFPSAQGMQLWFLTAFIDDGLVGYLVLKKVKCKVMGLTTSKVSFLVTHDTDRPHLVTRAEHQNPVSIAFYQYLLGRQQEWSFLEFQQQDNTSPLFPPPGAVDLKGYLVREWSSLENGSIRLQWGNLREYLKALPKSFHNNVRRQVRHLFAAGEVALLSSSHPATTPALFELYCGIEPYSWKSKAQVNISSQPQRIQYLKGLLDPQQPMRISIHILLLDGIPIAGLINGTFMTGLYALHMVYDDRLHRLAPGSTMLLLGIRHAIDGQYAFFNLLSGFGYFKQRWLADISATRIAQIYRIGSLFFWRRIAGDWIRRIFSRHLKRAVHLFNPVRRDVSENIGEQAAPGDNLKPQRSSAERQRIAGLITDIRRGQAEYLSAASLTSVMPFDTRSNARKKQPKQAPDIQAAEPIFRVRT